MVRAARGRRRKPSLLLEARLDLPSVIFEIEARVHQILKHLLQIPSVAVLLDQVQVHVRDPVPVDLAVPRREPKRHPLSQLDTQRAFIARAATTALGTTAGGAALGVRAVS